MPDLNQEVDKLTRSHSEFQSAKQGYVLSNRTQAKERRRASIRTVQGILKDMIRED